MDNPSQKIDLQLWLDHDLIKRQNRLKSAFLTLLEEVGNSFSNSLLQTYHLSARGVKISKGNDLLGCPYQVMDIIRDFDPEMGANIRLLNWFGHGCYVIYHLPDTDGFIRQLLLNKGFSFSITESPWDYPEMILAQATSTLLEDFPNAKPSPPVWIKALSLSENLQNNVLILQEEVKKLLEILKLSSE